MTRECMKDGFHNIYGIDEEFDGLYQVCNEGCHVLSLRTGKMLKVTSKGVVLVDRMGLRRKYALGLQPAYGCMRDMCEDLESDASSPYHDNYRNQIKYAAFVLPVVYILIACLCALSISVKPAFLVSMVENFSDDIFKWRAFSCVTYPSANSSLLLPLCSSLSTPFTCASGATSYTWTTTEPPPLMQMH